MNPQDKMYSRIIYKSPDDQDLQEILGNKNKSISPQKFKRWSPEISLEERTLRKKVREDEYIKKIYPNERPILLVKKKQKFNNLDNPNFSGSGTYDDRDFKVSRNTERLNDRDEDIEKNKKYIRRFTMVHEDKNKQQTKPNTKAVIKVDGIEYLPQGFLELDPLLLKDEYYFESDVLEKQFKDEQRKVKALRRKQYADKNYQKKRDVTIYVVEEFKDKVIEFLDLWFNKYKRKMNKAELEDVANRLETTFDNLNKLQELYLKKKKVLKAKQMKDNGRQYNKPSLSPMQVREQMKKGVKVMPGQYKHSPSYINKYNQKRNGKHGPISTSNSLKHIPDANNKFNGLGKTKPNMKLLGSGEFKIYQKLNKDQLPEKGFFF